MKFNSQVTIFNMPKSFMYIHAKTIIFKIDNYFLSTDYVR